MNKKSLIIASIAVVGAVMAGSVFFVSKKNDQASSCAPACSKASGNCPSLINKDICESKCSELSEETKKHLNDSSTCQELTSKPELIADLIVPDVNAPEKKAENGANDCEAACANYATQCLSLVPNATQEIFNDGIRSCAAECEKWGSEKITCILKAVDCPSMTDVCGL